MPDLDLLLLPLLGGYVFLITFSFTKFYHQRIERQRLIFNSLLLAFILSAIGLLIDQYLFKTILLDFRTLCGDILPIEKEGMKQSIFIFLLSYPLAKFLNIVLSNKRVFSAVVERWGNEIEKLFWASLNYKSDEDKLLMITTKSSKVYVGYVNKISEPIGNSYITIIPNFSGYRDKETLKFIVTTNYLKVLKHFIEKDQQQLIDKKMGIVIPKAEITIVSRFDPHIFNEFNTSTVTAKANVTPPADATSEKETPASK